MINSISLFASQIVYFKIFFSYYLLYKNMIKSLELRFYIQHKNNWGLLKPMYFSNEGVAHRDLFP